MSGPVKKKSTRAATLADVGRAAGVSAMAASAVLNDAQTSSRISPATRERILKAAAELRYRPNAAARALADRRMNTIGVIAVIDGGTAGELNPYFLEIFNGVIEAAALHQQNTTVFTIGKWQTDLARINSFCDGRIDGAVLIAPTIPAENAVHFPDHTPFVALHSNIPLPGVVNLESDEENGAYEMVRHLIAKGHRRILHLSGNASMLGAQRRIRGYRRALASAQLPFDPNLLVEATFNYAQAVLAFRNWLAQNTGHPLPDAIFGANDGVAIACLEVLAEIGIKVPDEISVAGFDDTVAARTTVPQLTTVRQPLRSMGRRAVEVLLDRIAHQHGPEKPDSPGSIVFNTELVLRNSVAIAPTSPRLVPTRIPAARG